MGVSNRHAPNENFLSKNVSHKGKLAEQYKGKLHELSKEIQETQEDGVSVFV